MVADAGSTNGTFVNQRRITSTTALESGDLVRLGPDVSLRFSIVDVKEELALTLAAERNDRDPLTGVLGRTYLEHVMEAEIQWARSKGTPLSVMMIDVDHFKAVNDSHGHLAGDEVLAGLGRIMQAAIRNTDVIARYGGEEWRSQVIRVTISVGVASLACFSSAADRLSLLLLADQRPYFAKRTRDSVVSGGGNPAVILLSRNDDATQAISR